MGSASPSYDVIIAGAGPVGLLLACELAIANVSVLVLEKDQQVSEPSQWKTMPFGVRGFNVPSVEAFYRRGLQSKVMASLDKFKVQEDKPGKAAKPKFAGHFAGNIIDGNLVDYGRFKYRLPGPAAEGGGTTVDTLENALSEHAKSLGVKILYGAGVSSFTESDSTIDVSTEDGQTHQASWLVGCDGGRSVVRKLASFEFVGTEAMLTGYRALAEIDHPERIQMGFGVTDRGMTISPTPGCVYVAEFNGEEVYDRSQALTEEHFETVLRRVTGADVRVKKIKLGSSFTDRSKQATTYRKGRVLLAGDAAHIHSPFGAQGLNLGIGDAFNLGWKLAATVKGTAPEGLLDTYTTERHPIGEWVLEWTRAQVMTIRPDLFGKATRRVTQDLLKTVDGATYFSERVFGLNQRYEPTEEGAHDLVGRSAPDFEFDDGEKLGVKIAQKPGLFTIVDFGGASSAAAIAKASAGKVEYVGQQAKEKCGLQTVLVRPDGIVAWVAKDGDEVDAESLKKELARWLTVDKAA